MPGLKGVTTVTNVDKRCRRCPIFQFVTGFKRVTIVTTFVKLTAVAWARGYFKKHPVSKDGGIVDMERQLKATLVDCAAYIHDNYEVDALCRSFPERLKALIAAGGERLSH